MIYIATENIIRRNSLPGKGGGERRMRKCGIGTYFSNFANYNMPHDQGNVSV